MCHNTRGAQLEATYIYVATLVQLKSSGGVTISPEHVRPYTAHITVGQLVVWKSAGSGAYGHTQFISLLAIASPIEALCWNTAAKSGTGEVEADGSAPTELYSKTAGGKRWLRKPITPLGHDSSPHEPLSTHGKRHTWN